VPFAVKNEKTLVLMLVEVREVPVAFRNEIPKLPRSTFLVAPVYETKVVVARDG
jgi:hypothetical protein